MSDIIFSVSMGVSWDTPIDTEKMMSLLSMALAVVCGGGMAGGCGLCPGYSFQKVGAYAQWAGYKWSDYVGITLFDSHIPQKPHS